MICFTFTLGKQNPFSPLIMLDLQESDKHPISFVFDKRSNQEQPYNSNTNGRKKPWWSLTNTTKANFYMKSKHTMWRTVTQKKKKNWFLKMKINYKTQTLFPCGVEDYTLTFIVPTHKTLIKYQIYSLDSKIVTLYSKLINGIITRYPPVVFL